MVGIKLFIIYFGGKQNGSKNQTSQNGRKDCLLYTSPSPRDLSPRDGKCIEEIGTFDPMKTPAIVNIDAEKAQQWIKNGAQPTDTVKALLKQNGIIK